MADVFNAQVVTLKVGEGAAYGAALQALWSLRNNQGDRVGIEEITNRFVRLNKRETTEPNPKTFLFTKMYKIYRVSCQPHSGLRFNCIGN